MPCLASTAFVLTCDVCFSQIEKGYTEPVQESHVTISVLKTILC